MTFKRLVVVAFTFVSLSQMVGATSAANDWICKLTNCAVMP